ncbi:aminotransferase class I and II [Dinoroseobacter shibae DFL 12 = DSM 16493]|jgi:aspartate/methionine/tyrosine aminotransferase|uniref:Aminotransferase class I and II n=1 Tax=Dinoroseobacter shibae (strain DSM 16493 / NCIMB 14021 / DFL 12) TaxID=398580 RepID=A8LJY3_DINSH|nr:aminotransferase class I/II-fold pyridoxal phosphate-dependent enzyme [Dinoroseobacter shibae]ABV91809.1 aminotransferase class I and II [Dinoroseobacter shibae DFL 12 = DSM 16493]URF46789.1 aminotransferase class I/II-fold pyridoxal phosphate-dependent enzyme [Dinoroseobacter shibae]URF51100.1 aminotransferase class I/II-fold pyridoxal phosphate-dependent enzyme [Dinoroseobacter shibae]
MDFPERFSALPEYAFPRLRALLDGHPPGGSTLAMSIGEPQHPFPQIATDALAEALPLFNKYPPNDGAPELCAAIADWVQGRYGVKLDPARQVLALNGTREGLFAACLALCPDTKAGGQPLVAMPNPFYQVYAVGAQAAGARPLFVNATAETGFLPNLTTLPPETLDRIAIAYVCSPSNPQGAVADAGYWRALIGLAEKHDFYVFADECYAEIYRETPPCGALEIATAMGADPERVVIFHSLSKRSNLPGLRSGFAAGGPRAMAEMKKLRAYAGAPLPGPLHPVATAVWRDEAHVVENRALYAAKFDTADTILGAVPGYTSPAAGFFLWLPVEDGEAAALKLWTETGVRVLPGAYLSRDTETGNPGAGFIRVALVADAPDVARGLTLIRDSLYS